MQAFQAADIPDQKAGPSPEIRVPARLGGNQYFTVELILSAVHNM